MFPKNVQICLFLAAAAVIFAGLVGHENLAFADLIDITAGVGLITLGLIKPRKNESKVGRSR